MQQFYHVILSCNFIILSKQHVSQKNQSFKHNLNIILHYLLHLRKVYNSDEMDPDKGPVELLHKVMFDIRYYFCRRGRENFQDFTKDTFKLMYYVETSITYVKKFQGELSKNHKEGDQEIITGFMPQLLDTNGRPHKLCPVRLFENYLAHLNPKINKLWQCPLNKKQNDIV